MAKLLTLLVVVMGGSSVALLAQGLLKREAGRGAPPLAAAADKASYIDRWAAARTRVPSVRVTLIGTVVASAAAVLLLATGNWTLD